MRFNAYYTAVFLLWCVMLVGCTGGIVDRKYLPETVAPGEYCSWISSSTPAGHTVIAGGMNDRVLWAVTEDQIKGTVGVLFEMTSSAETNQELKLTPFHAFTDEGILSRTILGTNNAKAVGVLFSVDLTAVSSFEFEVVADGESVIDQTVTLVQRTGNGTGPESATGNGVGSDSGSVTVPHTD